MINLFKKIAALFGIGVAVATLNPQTKVTNLSIDNASIDKHGIINLNINTNNLNIEGLLAGHCGCGTSCEKSTHCGCKKC